MKRDSCSKTKHPESKSIHIRKIRKRHLYSALLAEVAGLAIASCSKYPSYTVDTCDLDMVWTNFSETDDFIGYKTYYVPDTTLTDSTATDQEKAYFQQYYASVLDRVNTSMQERNYVRVVSSDNPDRGSRFGDWVFREREVQHRVQLWQRPREPELLHGRYRVCFRVLIDLPGYIPGLRANLKKFAINTPAACCRVVY